MATVWEMAREFLVNRKWDKGAADIVAGDVVAFHAYMLEQRPTVDAWAQGNKMLGIDAEPAAQPSAVVYESRAEMGGYDTGYKTRPLAVSTSHKPGAYTADRCHVCDELVSECKCAAAPSAREGWKPCPRCGSDFDGKLCHSCKNWAHNHASAREAQAAAHAEEVAKVAYTRVHKQGRNLSPGDVLASLHRHFPSPRSAPAADLDTVAEQNIKLVTENGKLHRMLCEIAETVALVPSVTNLPKACVEDHSLIRAAIRDQQDAFADTVGDAESFHPRDAGGLGRSGAGDNRELGKFSMVCQKPRQD